MKKCSRPVLFYVRRCPFKYANGNSTRVLGLIKDLTGSFDDVTIYGYEQRWRCSSDCRCTQMGEGAFGGATLLFDKLTQVHSVSRKLKRLLIKLFPYFSARILNISIPYYSNNLRRYFKKKSNAVVVCNYLDGLTELNGLNNKAVFVDTNDVMFVRKSKKKKTGVYDLSILAEIRYEIGCLEASSGIVAISPGEETLLKMLTNKNVYYVPISIAKRLKDNSEEKEFDILFVGGKMRFNEEGIKNFIKGNDQWIHHYRIAICGKVCEYDEIRVISNNRPNLHLLGYVDDLDAVFSSSKIVISPVEGTGQKTKVIDALAHAMPVFASEHSMEGLPPGFDHCVFPISEQSIKKLLDDPSELTKASISAKEYFEHFYETSEISQLFKAMNTVN